MDFELLDQIARDVKEKQDKRKLFNFVEYLLYSFQIEPNGRQIVWHFGKGGERTNREAIMAWVSRIIKRNNYDYDNEFVLEAIRELLEIELANVSDTRRGI